MTFTAHHPTFKTGENTGKENTNRIIYGIEGTTTIPDDFTVAAAAISAYAISTIGASIPENVTAFSNAVWQAARRIDSVSKLKKLNAIATLKLTSNDINFIVSVLVKNDASKAGGFKISAKNTVIQLILEVLYCKQEGIDYSCKERKKTKKPAESKTKKTTSKKPAKSKKTTATKTVA